jgi:nucleotide-binding universal stress UspA family protein
LHCESRQGNISEQILLAAEEGPADLIVIGACGLGAVARFFLGSIAERVARHATCPVLVARPTAGQFRKVVVGIDESESSAGAARWLGRFPLPEAAAIRLVAVLPATADLVRVSRTPPLTVVADPIELAQELRAEARERLATLTESLGSTGGPVDTELRTGHPAVGLMEAAEAWNADLLVVGAHGMSAVERLLMGSVSEHVLRHAPCSVLVVKIPGADTNG